MHERILVKNDSVHEHIACNIYSKYKCVGCHGNKPDGLEKGGNGERERVDLARQEVRLSFSDSDTS